MTAAALLAAALARRDLVRAAVLGWIRPFDAAASRPESATETALEPLSPAATAVRAALGAGGKIAKWHSGYAQAAGMEARRREGAAQRVHLGQRRQVAGVAEVVGVLAAGKGGAGFRLHSQEAGLLARYQPLAHEGEREAGEVATAPHAAYDDIRVLTGHFHLLDCFFTNHCLVQ